MFLILWEYEVKPGCEQRFQEVYSAGGDWDILFRSNENHAGTRLYRETSRANVYLTADYWVTRKSYEEFRNVRKDDYSRLDAASEHLTTSEKHIGSFELSPD
jgi:hypothetical protein